MGWINVFGLGFMAVILIPNIVFAVRNKEGFANRQIGRAVVITEQIGRIGCIVFMILHIPGTWFGWWSDEAFALYLIVDCLLVAAYCIVWIVMWRKNNMLRAMALSILPSAVFLFSGIMSRSVLLILASLLFAPAHIRISYANAK